MTWYLIFLFCKLTIFLHSNSFSRSHQILSAVLTIVETVDQKTGKICPLMPHGTGKGSRGETNLETKQLPRSPVQSQRSVKIWGLLPLTIPGALLMHVACRASLSDKCFVALPPCSACATFSFLARGTLCHCCRRFMGPSHPHQFPKLFAKCIRLWFYVLQIQTHQPQILKTTHMV